MSRLIDRGDPPALRRAFVITGPTLFLAPPAEPAAFETPSDLCARIKLEVGDRVISVAPMNGSFRGSATFAGFYVFETARTATSWQGAVALGGDRAAFERLLIAAGVDLGQDR